MAHLQPPEPSSPGLLAQPTVGVVTFLVREASGAHMLLAWSRKLHVAQLHLLPSCIKTRAEAARVP